MNRITRKKLRIGLHAKGFNKEGKRILHTSMRIPTAFIHRIEASPAVKFNVRVVYGRAKTNSGRVEEIINEIEAPKREVIDALRIFVSHSELDEMEKYWNFI